MKPSWDDAPDWASYAAQDENGSWWWYECIPVIEDNNWDRSEGRYQKAYSSEINWKDSLERRP